MRVPPHIITVFILIFPMYLCGQPRKTHSVSPANEIKVKYYEVTETIHSEFGSAKVVYTVSNKNLINTNDLGPNNTREVKEVIVYKRKNNGAVSHLKSEKIKDEKVPEQSKRELEDTLVVPLENRSTKTIIIDPLQTYERMIQQGIISQELYSQLADAYFYKNEYTKASQYYFELFKIGKKIKPEYYFRYAMALKNIGQEKRSKELLATYEALLQSENKK